MGRKLRPRTWNRTSAWTVLCRGLLAIPLVLLTLGSGSPTFSEFRFTVEPRDTVVVKDRPAMLDCVAQHESTPPDDVQWIREADYMTFNSRRYKLSNGSLYFETIEHSSSHQPDEGTYQCVASVRHLGTVVSRKAQVSVTYLAKDFSREPVNLAVHLGDTAMMPCEIDSVPKPTVRWYKDELELDSQGVNYHLHTDGVLEIGSVQFSDFGRYQCKVENGDRSRISGIVSLSQDTDVATYQEVTPRFMITPTNKVALEATTVMFYCGANGRDREANRPTISWLKDGSTIDLANLDSRFSIVGQGSLRIDALQSSDSGSYTCRATNSEDSVDAVASLTVNVAPRFQKRPKNAFANINADVEFECEATGSPPPQVTWMKNGDKINPSDYFQISDGHNLKILGLVASDDGMYQCFAENAVGNIQASAQLIIVQPGSHSASALELPSVPRNLHAAIVDTRFVTLSWSAPDQAGTSEVQAYAVYWKEQGSQRERVMNTTKREANIQHLKPATKYEFRVVAYNDAGPSRYAAEIQVDTSPEVTVPGAPVNLQAFPLSSSSMQVHWEAPADTQGAITNYKLYYYAVGADEEQDVNVMETGFTLDDLQVFRQYSFRVVAFNSNGAGVSTEEVMARTYSAAPAEPPQNISLESVSSSSIVVRWEPPQEGQQNGLITGYKIKWKERRNKERADSVTTDGDRKSHAFTDLSRGTEYQFRMAAINVNGSSPVSSWFYVKTYMTDLDESTVPGRPTSLHVRPMTDSILVSWTPPSEQDIMIRGYVLGYGIGIPDVYRQFLDAKQRYHTIKNLKPSSEYVINLRAYNDKGEGRPIYETTFTREVTTPEPQTPMSTPLGLKATVLSATTVVLTWSDTSLGRNQRINDNRYYNIRYNPKLGRKHKYLNATDLNAHINDLRPDTEYEFMVKVIKGHRQSPWSMSTFTRTLEAAPQTAPRDLTPVGMPNQHRWVMISWQPPRQPNGQITGYIVLYTTDATLPDQNWVVDGIVGGEQLSTIIKDLTPETTYYFKVQARNSMGNGPMSPTVIFRTPKSDGTGGGQIELPDDYGRVPYDPNRGHNKDDFDLTPDKISPRVGQREGKDKSQTGGISPMVLYIIIGCVGGVTAIAVAAVAIILCRRRVSDGDRKKRKGPGYMPANKGKPGPGNHLKPPDLWIHTDQMELKSMDKSNPNSLNATSLPPEDAKAMEDGTTAIAKATAMPNGHLGGPESGVVGPTPIRPVYPRTQYQCTSTPRVNAGDISQPSSDEHSTSTMDRRKARADKMRKQSSSNPRLTVRPQPQQPQPQPQQQQQQHQQHPSQGPQPGSPYKKPNPPTSTTPTNLKSRPPMPVVSPRAPDVTIKGGSQDETSELLKSISTEELTAEMANLEGLMKDLNAITQQEFEC